MVTPQLRIDWGMAIPRGCEHSRGSLPVIRGGEPAPDFADVDGQRLGDGVRFLSEAVKLPDRPRERLRKRSFGAVRATRNAVEDPVQGGASNGFLGRATIGW